MNHDFSSIHISSNSEEKRVEVEVTLKHLDASKSDDAVTVMEGNQRFRILVCVASTVT